MVKSVDKNFDVIVVGAGHAGIEAAYAAAQRGSKTALITLDKNRIGYMPCNPAIGGIGKGHIVFEVSALGGLMPQLCTQTYLQVRMLNTSKGPAVHGLRLQIDKHAYSKAAQQTLECIDNLTIIEAMVQEILTSENSITGVLLQDGTELMSKTVVVTTGTFLKGLVHVGLENYESGREHEKPAISLSDSLKKLGLRLGRLKTGTPPRLLRSSIDFSVLEKQESDELNFLFDFYPHKTKGKLDCYITHTNERVHQIIKDNAHLSPILRKEITGIGPRYCPSIEDKITRFPDKNAHQIFVEPESLSTDWIYPNGLSTSLPLEIQKQYIQAIKGFENAVIVQPGYAIEYDMVLPDQLTPFLEVKTISGLFLAGQINGTTGYEEAAGQGIIAGINASLKSENKEPFILNRDESYIGIMIDDLTTLSIDEPYRMFTSRAERRLLLRQDNAFLRLTEKAYKIGLIKDQMYKDFIEEKNLITSIIKDLKNNFKNTDLLRIFSENDQATKSVEEVLGKKYPDRMCQTIQAEIKYEPYIEREAYEVERASKHRDMKIPENFEYKNIDGLSIELQQKLHSIRPSTIAQALIIPGMTPAAISLLMLKINMFHRKGI